MTFIESETVLLGRFEHGHLEQSNRSTKIYFNHMISLIYVDFCRSLTQGFTLVSIQGYILLSSSLIII